MNNCNGSWVNFNSSITYSAKGPKRAKKGPKKEKKKKRLNLPIKSIITMGSSP